MIADLLLIANDGRHPVLTLDGQQRRQQTLQVLQTQLDVLALQQPVLMIFEDIHWIDPTSLELLNMLVERIRSRAVLLIVTFRPELDPPWQAHPHVDLDTQSTRRTRGYASSQAFEEPGVAVGVAESRSALTAYRYLSKR